LIIDVYYCIFNFSSTFILRDTRASEFNVCTWRSGIQLYLTVGLSMDTKVSAYKKIATMMKTVTLFEEA
jgi:hypothetical protein